MVVDVILFGQNFRKVLDDIGQLYFSGDKGNSFAEKFVSQSLSNSLHFSFVKEFGQEIPLYADCWDF